MIKIDKKTDIHGYYNIIELDKDGKLIKEHKVNKNIVTNQGKAFLAKLEPYNIFIPSLLSSAEDIKNNRYHYANIPEISPPCILLLGNGYGEVSATDTELFNLYGEEDVVYYSNNDNTSHLNIVGHNKDNYFIPSDIAGAFTVNPGSIISLAKSHITLEVSDLLNETYPEGYYAYSTYYTFCMKVKHAINISEVGLAQPIDTYNSNNDGSINLAGGYTLCTHSMLNEEIVIDSGTASIIVTYVLTEVYSNKPYVCDVKIGVFEDTNTCENTPAEYEAYIQYINPMNRFSGILSTMPYTGLSFKYQDFLMYLKMYQLPYSCYDSANVPLWTNKDEPIDFNRFTIDTRKLSDALGTTSDIPAKDYTNYYNQDGVDNVTFKVIDKLKDCFPLMPAEEAKEYFRPINETYTHEELKALLTEPMYYNAFVNALSNIPKYKNDIRLFSYTTFDQIKAFVDREMGDLTDESYYFSDEYYFGFKPPRPGESSMIPGAVVGHPSIVIPNMKFFVLEQLNQHKNAVLSPVNTSNDNSNFYNSGYMFYPKTAYTPYTSLYKPNNTIVEQGKFLGFIAHNHSSMDMYSVIINSMTLAYTKPLMLVIIRNKQTLKPITLDYNDILTYLYNYPLTKSFYKYGSNAVIYDQKEYTDSSSITSYIAKNVFDVLDLDTCFSKVYAFYSIGYSFIMWYELCKVGIKNNDTQWISPIADDDTWKNVGNEKQIELFTNMFNKALSIDFTGVDIVKEIFKTPIPYRRYFDINNQGYYYDTNPMDDNDSFIGILKKVKDYVSLVKSEPLLEPIHTLFEQYAAKWEELLGTDMSKVLPELTRQLDETKKLAEQYKLTQPEWGLPGYTYYRLLPTKDEKVNKNFIVNNSYLLAQTLINNSGAILKDKGLYYKEAYEVTKLLRDNYILLM